MTMGYEQRKAFDSVFAAHIEAWMRATAGMVATPVGYKQHLAHQRAAQECVKYSSLDLTVLTSLIEGNWLAALHHMRERALRATPPE